jgi:hypothetical protein
MLVYYVVSHRRQVWAPYLFSDENIEETRTNRNPVMTAKPSKKVTAKKRRNYKIKFETESKTNEGNVSEIEEQVQSFQTLLSHLATIGKNECRMANENINFNTKTTPTPFQEILLKQRNYSVVFFSPA